MVGFLLVCWNWTRVWNPFNLYMTCVKGMFMFEWWLEPHCIIRKSWKMSELKLKNCTPSSTNLLITTYTWHIDTFYIHMEVSENHATPQIIHFNRVFHYKPFILGYPLFLETPVYRSPFPPTATVWEHAQKQPTPQPNHQSLADVCWIQATSWRTTQLSQHVILEHNGKGPWSS